mmetsp:Transcript_11347/g.14294  ORF Transcript_11347/g.14294 Transcript_11347/m.14294 type:complete len:105 (-) Transcript_11347:1757-2071(-)
MGGRKITIAFVKHCYRELCSRNGSKNFSPAEEAMIKSSLFKLCERAKLNLSTKEQSSMNVTLLKTYQLDMILDRSLLDSCSEDVKKKSVETIHRVLRDASLDKT